MQLKGEYLTITEIAEKLGITYLAAKQRLLRAGIKPVTTDTLYLASAIEAIRNVPGKGRPKKAEPEPEPTKLKEKKPAKSKK
jgi:hypothetical protein